MPYPTANELYEIASNIGEVDGSLVRAASDELVERRKAMQFHDYEVGRLKALIRGSIRRLSPSTSHEEIDALINSL